MRCRAFLLCLALFAAMAKGITCARTPADPNHASGMISPDIENAVRTLVAQGNHPWLQAAVVW